MSALVITGVGVWTAAGRGIGPLRDVLLRRDRCFTEVPPYDAAGLRQPRCAVVQGLDRSRPAEQLLDVVVTDAIEQAGLVPPSGTGLVVGTSSGNICGPWERWHRAHLVGEPTNERGTGRDAPAREVAARHGLDGPVRTVSIACASGTAVFGVAMGWLEEGIAPIVVVAGADALSLYVHAGFDGLGALSATVPEPFSPRRDGLLLGEGAAAFVVETEDNATARGADVLAVLAGAGLGADAFHATAPHRAGRGAARAMQIALADAGLKHDAIDMLSVHGTGTVFNDAMECQAIRSVFGERAVSLHGIKGSIGHTLGAAGAIEAAVVVDALAHRWCPPSPTEFAPDCDAVAPVALPHAKTALSTSSAFGGANAAVVFTRRPMGVVKRDEIDTETIGRGQVEIAAGSVDWKVLWPTAPARFRRLNRYVRVGLIAVARALESSGPVSSSTGIVLGTRYGCRATDLVYHERIVGEGAAMASRLHFTYTVPGAPAGEVAITWNLQGPSLTFIGEHPDEAIDEAHRMVRTGRVKTVIALVCDVMEPGGAGGARAMVIRATE